MFEDGAGIFTGGESVIAAEDEQGAAEIADVLHEAIEGRWGKSVGGLVVDDDYGGGEILFGEIGKLGGGKDRAGRRGRLGGDFRRSTIFR